MPGTVAFKSFDAAKEDPSGGSPSLYTARRKIFPRRGKGPFRNLKWLIMAITLGIYYLTPWIRWDRGPHAPDQAVLVDIANRRFYFFFIEIWPQEFFLVAGLLVMAGIGLFLVTSTVGRAWCGYTCPQTVWVDLFLVVERAIEGDRNARMRLDSAPWTTRKIGLRTLKHGIWLLIGVATGGAWIFYFADAPTLARDFMNMNAAPIAYITVGILTATTYVFGGLMREQVCIYMCPWPRIQAAMLDEHSLTVTYNDWRGEPRTRGTKKAQAQGFDAGDCIDCNACVAVCPMGIDIRDGQQLACITCALCIDACDDIMGRLGRERGLISYATLADYNANMALATGNGAHEIRPSLVRDAAGRFTETVAQFRLGKLFRPRTVLYLGIWVLAGLLLLYGVLTRDRLEISVLHDRNPQFVLLADGSIRNGYTVKLLNKVPEERTVSLRLAELSGATMNIVGMEPLDGNEVSLTLEPDRAHSLKIYVRQSQKNGTPGASQRLVFEVEDPSNLEVARYVTRFESPEGP